ncbi:MAG: hypothetical protein M3O36_11710 [Myxococcota bacterium]|nr:hypothetical protein [Myxococcota bacterium]
MKRVIRFGFCGVVLVGCSSSSTPATPGDAGGSDSMVASDATPAKDSPSVTAGDSATKMPAPAELLGFESNTEGISDNAYAMPPDWTKAKSSTDEAKTKWAVLKPLVTAAGASSATVAFIDTALANSTTDIAAMAKKKTELDGNSITLKVPELFDLFTFPVPSKALAGDGGFRALQIDGEWADWATAATDLAFVQSLWNDLQNPPAGTFVSVGQQALVRTDVPGSLTIVLDMTAAIKACADAITAKDQARLQAQAQNGLDFIDTIEALYKPGTSGDCSDGGTCSGAHIVCDPLDHQCKRDGTDTKIGGTCPASGPSAACGSAPLTSLVCNDLAIDGFPGGYCTIDACTTKQNCPVGSSCAALGGESGSCYTNCATDADCRVSDGYMCTDTAVVAGNPPLLLSGASTKVCYPRSFKCVTDKDCPADRPHCLPLAADGGIESGAPDAATDSAAPAVVTTCQ